MKTYKAEVTREGKWWMVAIPELDGLTQARRLGEVELMAREWIALTTNSPMADVAVEVVIDRIVGLPVGETVAEMRSAKDDAKDLEAHAATLASWLAQQLASKEVPVRDIGTILGVSFQRAHQLVAAGKDAH